REQVEALFGQPVFDLAAIVGAGFALEDTVFDQPREAVREDVARDAEHREEILEMVDLVERGAQDQERPALAHHFERLWQPAFGRGIQGLAQLAHSYPFATFLTDARHRKSAIRF